MKGFESFFLHLGLRKDLGTKQVPYLLSLHSYDIQIRRRVSAANLVKRATISTS